MLPYSGQARETKESCKTLYRKGHLLYYSKAISTFSLPEKAVSNKNTLSFIATLLILIFFFPTPAFLCSSSELLQSTYISREALSKYKKFSVFNLHALRIFNEISQLELL